MKNIFKITGLVFTLMICTVTISNAEMGQPIPAKFEPNSAFACITKDGVLTSIEFSDDMLYARFDNRPYAFKYGKSIDPDILGYATADGLSDKPQLFMYVYKKSNHISIGKTHYHCFDFDN